MYHSVSFWSGGSAEDGSDGQLTDTGGRNTWASWRLIPTSRPYITPPTQKTVYQDIPYRSGKLDLSELGIIDSVFNNREGSFEFAVMNDMVSGYDHSRHRMNDGNAFNNSVMPKGRASMWSWDKTYSTVMDYLQGERRKIVLEDDPGFYYIGRTEVEALTSEEHFTKIGIKYDVDPFKRERFSTTENWVWDAIDFDYNPDLLGFKNVVLQPYAIDGYRLEGSFTTLRNRIYPEMKVSIASNPNQEPEDRPLVELLIFEGSNMRKIRFQKGTNKISKNYSEDDLYFSGLTDVRIVICNLMSSAKVKISFDYRREGL